MTHNALVREKTLPTLGLLIYGLTGLLGAFSGSMWGTFGIAGALLLFSTTWIIDKELPWPEATLAKIVFIILAVLALEIPISSNVMISFKTWLHLASIFLPLLLLFNRHIRQKISSPYLIPWAVIASTLGALGLWLELSSGGVFLHYFKNEASPLTDYNRGIAHLVILAFPLGAGLWLAGARLSAFFLGCILLFPAGMTESHTAKLALFAGALGVVCGYVNISITRQALKVLSCLLALWPLGAQYIFAHDFSFVESLPPSWRHRMEIWDYLSYRIEERPLFGWGLGTTHTLDFKIPHGELYRFAVEPAPHAHNFVVQIWTETGLPGIFLMGVVLVGILNTVPKLHKTLQPFALGSFTAALTVALFGFDFWTDALWSCFALSAFVFFVLEQDIKRKHDGLAF